MPDIPDDLIYSKDHLWARPGAGAGVVRVGVTDFAQQSLGDVIDVTLPRPGDTLQAGVAEHYGGNYSIPLAAVAGTVAIVISALMLFQFEAKGVDFGSARPEVPLGGGLGPTPAPS